MVTCQTILITALTPMRMDMFVCSAALEHANAASERLDKNPSSMPCSCSFKTVARRSSRWNSTCSALKQKIAVSWRFRAAMTASAPLGTTPWRWARPVAPIREAKVHMRPREKADRPSSSWGNWWHPRLPHLRPRSRHQCHRCLPRQPRRRHRRLRRSSPHHHQPNCRDCRDCRRSTGSRSILRRRSIVSPTEH